VISTSLVGVAALVALLHSRNRRSLYRFEDDAALQNKQAPFVMISGASTSLFNAHLHHTGSVDLNFRGTSTKPPWTGTMSQPLWTGTASVTYPSVAASVGWGTIKPTVASVTVGPDHNTLKPLFNLADGNDCPSDEEKLSGLCYKKCALLVPDFPKRKSAFTCCAATGCTFLASSTKSLIPCRGYDVSATGSCPHPPGACLTNEELYLGLCYKMCSLLTKGVYSVRIASATCCKAKGLDCLDFSKIETSPKFAIGGGAGDGDPTTPGKVHFPLKELTEH